jgi:hypothetical protein
MKNPNQASQDAHTEPMRSRALAAVLLACLVAPASAATFCVHDGVELEAALASAATNGEDDNIKLAPGTYTPSGDGFVYNSDDLHGLAMGGGYAAPPGSPPCGIFLGGAQWSVLDGAGSKRLFQAYMQGTSAAPVFLHDLSFVHGVSTASDAGVLYMTGSSDWTGDLLLENVSVHANASGLTIAQLSARGRIFVRSSEFFDNTSTAGTGVILGLLTDRPGSGVAIAFNNNSIAGNSVPATSTRAGLAVGGNGPGDVRITNNILWANGGTDLSLASAGAVFLDHDDIGSRAVGGGVVVTDTSPYLVDPGLIAPHDLRLRPDSPLRDAGHTAPIGGSGSNDVDGEARVEFGTIDVGAHEVQDRIFDDDFDSELGP